jgi:hypothetical protein
MTLGCGAAAGNITSDTIGPQHLYNVRRLAYVVRKPEEAIPPAPSEEVPAQRSVMMNREAVASAVDRYLASRGIGSAAYAAAAAAGAQAAPAVQSFPASQTTVPARAGIAAEVVDRFLARRSETLPEVVAASPACKPGGG